MSQYGDDIGQTWSAADRAGWLGWLAGHHGTGQAGRTAQGETDKSISGNYAHAPIYYDKKVQGKGRNSLALVNIEESVRLIFGDRLCLLCQFSCDSRQIVRDVYSIFIC